MVEQSENVSTLGMNVELDFHGYCIIEVWQKTTAEQREEVAQFWLREVAICDENQARQRAHQLVTVVRDSSGRLAGVSTAYQAVLGKIKATHFFYRMFISAKNRRSRLMIRVIEFSQEVLKQYLKLELFWPAIVNGAKQRLEQNSD